MKKLFVIILSLLPFIGFASEQVQFPHIQFQSTSVYPSVSNYTPQITEVGSINVYNSQQSISNLRKVSGNPYNPYQTPIGDVPILYIACFSCIFLFYKQLNLE